MRRTLTEHGGARVRGRVTGTVDGEPSSCRACSSARPQAQSLISYTAAGDTVLRFQGTRAQPAKHTPRYLFLGEGDRPAGCRGRVTSSGRACVQPQRPLRACSTPPRQMRTHTRAKSPPHPSKVTPSSSCNKHKTSAPLPIAHGSLPH